MNVRSGLFFAEWKVFNICGLAIVNWRHSLSLHKQNIRIHKGFYPIKTSIGWHEWLDLKWVLCSAISWGGFLTAWCQLEDMCCVFQKDVLRTLKRTEIWGFIKFVEQVSWCIGHSVLINNVFISVQKNNVFMRQRFI